MLFQLPNDSVLYRSLLQRDESYEGLAWVGVTTTQIFCRLSCPARKPQARNCRFFDNVADCLDSGFRPCKRCRPLHPLSTPEPLVTQLIELLEREPERCWREAHLIALKLDPSTVRRTFKRHFGLTFLEMARLRRLRSGIETIADGATMIDAQQQAGFESPSGFRHAVAKLIDMPPSSLNGPHTLVCGWIDTPLGPMIAVGDDNALHLLEFFDRKGLPAELKRLLKKHSTLGIAKVDQHTILKHLCWELTQYFAGKLRHFETPLCQVGSAFTQTVWDALIKIAPGSTCSYGELARHLGRPGSSRAVARANGANTLSIIVPCHRVIGADGSLTGYGGGLWRKRWLLDHERQMFATDDDVSVSGATQ